MTDIKQALFDMALYKAPREDGFYAGFYQTMWDIVGASPVADLETPRGGGGVGANSLINFFFSKNISIYKNKV